MIVYVPARDYEDFDDCLAAAARDYAEAHGLARWQVAAAWADDEREEIALTIETASLYTTWGSVRGCCGHVHDTYERAADCVDRDGRSCRRAGSGCYSDREVREIESAEDIEDFPATRGPGSRVYFGG